MKRLIINADDFGFTKDVNAGIVHAHREGVLTSTTLMANGSAFDDAVSLAKQTPTLDVGCHLVLVQGHSVATGRELPRTPVQLCVELVLGRLNVLEELDAQITKIRATGIRPSHLDTHKHTHLLPNVFSAVVQLAEKYGIPFVRLPFDETIPFSRAPMRMLGSLARRYADVRNVKITDHFAGLRLTGSLNEGSLLKALESLAEGTTEFMCHPGFLTEDLRGSVTRLKESRVAELAALTSPRVRQALHECRIELSSFAEASGSYMSTSN